MKPERGPKSSMRLTRHKTGLFTAIFGRCRSRADDAGIAAAHRRRIAVLDGQRFPRDASEPADAGGRHFLIGDDEAGYGQRGASS
jgi:hypothetical protein